MTFDNLHKEFSSTKDISSFVEKDKSSINYLLIRSLDKEHLLNILDNKKIAIPKDAKPKIDELYSKVFSLNLPQKELISFIKLYYPSVKKSRSEAEDGLAELLRNFKVVRCGLRNDRLDVEVSKVVRNKNIRSWDDLNLAFNKLTLKARQYAEWSYVNQAATDLIEHYINDHPKVIPTLRKIPNLDFFYDFGEKGLVPFDLKITNISEEFFNEVESEKFGLSCIHEMKAVYKNLKKIDKTLPPLSLFESTEEVYDFLFELRSKYSEINNLIEKIKDIRANTIDSLLVDRNRLELWNYINQGPRLFCNNNRFFVFLAFKDNFGDARSLKKKVSEIGELITNHLNSINYSQLNKLNYSYSEEAQLAGNYSTISSSVLLSE
jgi:hypothetical protein